MRCRGVGLFPVFRHHQDLAAAEVSTTRHRSLARQHAEFRDGIEVRDNFATLL